MNQHLSERFRIFITHGQICVFDPKLPKPFNDWSEKHVRQGFSWRKGSVSFKTIVDGGMIDVTVRHKATIKLSKDSRRSIRVPFTVPQNGLIEVGSISDTRIIEMSPGNVDMFFETGVIEEKMWASFTFLPRKSRGAQILVSESAIDTSDPLLMDAEPA